MAVIARLTHVTRLIQERIAKAAAEHGVQVADGDILFTLRRANQRLSPSKLSESLMVATGTMTGRIDRLEKLGLVRRIPHATDRRALEIELTEHGRGLVDQVVGAHLAREHQMLSVLSDEEREQLVRITRKLLVHLENG